MVGRPPHVWIPTGMPPVLFGGQVDHDPILGGMTDGWPHRRLQSGFCPTCQVKPSEMHRAVSPSRAPDTPIYDALLQHEIRRREIRDWLLIRGIRPEDMDSAADVLDWVFPAVRFTL